MLDSYGYPALPLAVTPTLRRGVGVTARDSRQDIGRRA